MAWLRAISNSRPLVTALKAMAFAAGNWPSSFILRRKAMIRSVVLTPEGQMALQRMHRVQRAASSISSLVGFTVPSARERSRKSLPREELDSSYVLP